MSIQSSPDSKTTEVCSFTLDIIKKSNLELKELNKEALIDLKVAQQANKILEDENTVLKRVNIELKNETIKEETLIQLIDENLQSSKRVLQFVCAIAGAILGGSAVLVFPPAGAAIALVGTGSAATGVAVAGVAVAGGATGGCLVAPVIHNKTHKEAIQQVQNFKAKQEVSKKVE